MCACDMTSSIRDCQMLRFCGGAFGFGMYVRANVRVYVHQYVFLSTCMLEYEISDVVFILCVYMYSRERPRERERARERKRKRERHTQTHT